VFTGIHHVAVAVRNLDAALVFYRDILGLPVGRLAVVVDQGVKAALLPVGEDEIELLEPTNPSGGVARFLEKKGEGIHHLCVETTDITAALTQAKAANLPLIDQVPRQGLAGTIGFLHPGATQGILVELAQPIESEHHTPRGGNGVKAKRIATIYAAVKDLSAAATTFANNFGAAVSEPENDGCFETKRRVVGIGNSRLTLLGMGGLSASKTGSRVFGRRGDGLFGLSLSVEDSETACCYLERKGVRAEMIGAIGDHLGWIPAIHAHGVNIFLCR